MVSAGILASCGGGHGGSIVPSLSPMSAGSESTGTRSRSIASVTADPYTNLVLSDGVLAFYRLNDTGATMAALTSTSFPVSDFNGSYGNEVTLNDPGLTTQSGGTAFFHGSGAADQIASAYSNPAFATAATSISIEAWIKPNSLLTDYFLPIVSYGRGFRGQAWVLQLNPQGRLVVALKTGGGTSHLPATTSSLVGNTPLIGAQTYHVVATYDGSTAKLFVNGVADGAENISGPIDYDNTYPGLALGVGGTVLPNASGAQWSYSGPLQNVGIYTTALQPQQIANHYHVGTTVPVTGPYAADVLADNPLAYYRLDDVTSGFMYSSASTPNLNGSYGTNVVLKNPALTSELSDASALFPGAGALPSIATVPANAAFATAQTGFTVEAWIKPTSLQTTYYIPIVSYGRQVQGQAWVLQINAQSYLNFWAKTAQANSLNGHTKFVVGNIYQIAATYDGTTAKIYVDGVLDGSLAMSGPLDYSGIAPQYGLGIGGALGTNTSGLNSSFAGAIDDVSIYPSALNASRIALHYRDGTQGTPPVTGPKIYVAETTANTIATFDPNGNASTPTITKTSTNGLNNPGGVALDSSGIIYVENGSAGYGSPQVVTTYNPDGSRAPATMTLNYGAPFLSLLGIDANNTIYFGQFDGGSYIGSVSMYKSDGSTFFPYMSPITLQNNDPVSIAFSPSGAMYIAWSAYLGDCTVTSGGQTIIDFPFPSCPNGIAFDPAGKLHVANEATNDVRTYNADGSASSPTITAGINAPRSVAVDSSGKIYVGNAGNNTLTTYNADGSRTTPTINLPGSFGFTLH